MLLQKLNKDRNEQLLPNPHSMHTAHTRRAWRRETHTKHDTQLSQAIKYARVSQRFMIGRRTSTALALPQHDRSRNRRLDQPVPAPVPVPVPVPVVYRHVISLEFLLSSLPPISSVLYALDAVYTTTHPDPSLLSSAASICARTNLTTASTDAASCGTLCPAW